MATFSRKAIKAMGIDEEKIDTLIDMHTEVVDGLKEELANAKKSADRLETVQKELDEMKAEKEKSGNDPFKVKYEALKEDFDKYKADQTAKETKAAKESAYKSLLKDAGIAEKRIDAIIKVSDLNGIEIDDKGAIKGYDDLKKSIQTEWADFIQTTSEKGANTGNPPANNQPDYDSMSDDDYYKSTYEASKKKGA